jgi:hypothetical protein
MQRDAKHIFRLGMIVLLFLVIVGYAYYQSQKLLEGPEIIIDSPKNGAVVNDSFLEIKGVAKNIKSINMDGRPIFLDEEGRIDEKLLLYPGLNIIKFEAEDKFGKHKELDLEIYLSSL